MKLLLRILEEKRILYKKFMKKILHIALFLIFISFYSCNHNTRMEKSVIQIIPVNVDRENVFKPSDFIEKIEIVPLQTDTDYLVSTYQKMTYNKDSGLFIILDKDLSVYLFSNDGTIFSNSKSVQGQGPGEYSTIVDVIYNPYTKAIELLDPYGTIYRYDLSFHFIEKVGLNQNSIVFSRFAPVNINQYILTPVLIGKNDAVIYFCNYENKKMSEAISYEDEYIATIAMNYNLFFTENNRTYFSPIGLDYYFYQIDYEKQSLIPILQLDFGSKNVDKNEIKKKFGNFSNSSKSQTKFENNRRLMAKINEFLLNSNKPLPIIKFFNDRYIYVYFLNNKTRNTFIYNRATKKSFLQTADDSLQLYFCLDIEDNVLIAMAQSYELDKYVDTQFMDNENILKMKAIKEDDNPVVIKYYLK